ncbi:hypothetical protein GGU10DRAFT_350429 [Lentinula aff. detonsa]|uniref:DNA breaking-rejoining enzyme n=1 Tax=Lentinula aff. detonsa TaxID=2804958 RepID=A0AA38KH54_9AGAR|nr:hypothetical protein GGU10DRAFT_350429 [Lentinula aff. detonsa]
MLALYFELDLSTSFHCAIWAVACMAFWGCRRLGELTIPSTNKFNLKYHVSRNTLITPTFHADNTPKAISFRIPWSKTTKEDGALVVATAQNSTLSTICPYRAFTLHLEHNNNLPDNFSLFGFLDEFGRPQHMVKSTFLLFCDRIWKAKGLAYVNGHSFRIGGAVELLIAGVSPEVVAAIGGWTSLAFLIYWRRFQDIIPTHILKAYTPQQVERLKYAMNFWSQCNFEQVQTQKHSLKNFKHTSLMVFSRQLSSSDIHRIW